MEISQNIKNRKALLIKSVLGTLVVIIAIPSLISIAPSQAYASVPIFHKFLCNTGIKNCPGGPAPVAAPAPAPAPVCVANNGTSCTSSANICGQVNTGTVACDGSCTAISPLNSSCPQVTLGFGGAGGSIILGQSTILRWNSTNTTSCTASGGFSTGGVPSGSVTITPTNTSTYQIICLSTGGISTTASATITVLVPTINNFTASPTRVLSGGSSIVKWDVSNVNSCTTTGPGLSATSLKGSQKVSNITHQSTFTLLCKTFTTPLTKSIIVNVNPKFKLF